MSLNVHEKYLNFLFKRKYDTLANMLRTSFCQFTSVRKYEELAKVAEETKKNFAAYERDDLKLREVSSSLYPLCLPSFYLSIYLSTNNKTLGVQTCTSTLYCRYVI